MKNLTTIFSSSALPPLRSLGGLCLVANQVLPLSRNLRSLQPRQSLLLSSRRTFIARSLPAKIKRWRGCQGPTTSSDDEGSTERPAKKASAASSASVMHMQPLRSDDDDGHNLLLSTLTGGHGVFMAEAELSALIGGHGVFIAEAEVNEVKDWYDLDNDWYDSDNNGHVPLFDAHATHGSASRISPVVTEPSFSTPSTKQCGLTSSLLAMRLSRPSPQQWPSCRNSAPGS
jgi:hypothetical protein